MPGGLNIRKRLFAKCLSSGCDEREAMVAEYKHRLFAHLHGTVVEIGPGTGANLSYLPHDADLHWIGIEPNPYMHPHLKARAARLGLTPDLRDGTAETIDVPNASADAVISTHVLCSVNDPQAAVHEVLRVLKPGGKFLFVEHVAAPHGTSTRRWQNWIRPAWQYFVDGCRPNRETWRTLETAGFADVQFDRFTLSIPIVGPHISGTATK